METYQTRFDISDEMVWNHRVYINTHGSVMAGNGDTLEEAFDSLTELVQQSDRV